MSEKKRNLMVNINAAIHNAQEYPGGLDDFAVLEVIQQILAGAIINVGYKMDDLEADLKHETELNQSVIRAGKAAGVIS